MSPRFKRRPFLRPLIAALLFAAAPATALEARLVTLDRLPRDSRMESLERRPDMLPDGVVVRGRRNIHAAWLTGPTGRYRHGVLGDDIEAAGLAVVLSGRRVLLLSLGLDAVFEDRTPRLVDLDGDGRDEVLVVKSYLDEGAALAIAAVADDRLAIVAEGEPIGRANRWLNPVGAGDFDGDGRVETAHVETPHIGGSLILSRRQGARLVEVRRESGFFNHRMGSPILGLSAVLDANDDGVPDIIVPDENRRAIRIVTFAGGRFRQLARIALPAEVDPAFHLADLDRDGKMDVALRLYNGQAVGVILRR